MSTAEMTTPHRVIRASAGSGKTFQLTGHYIRLLRAGAEPSQILATTFTRKAAGEIQGKILTRLVDAIDDDQKRADLAHHTGGGTLDREDCLRLLRQLVGSMHRLAISTIDGFFHRIAGSFRYELDLPLEPRLVDGASPAARTLRQEAIRAMLADAEMHELLVLLRRLHHDSATRRVTDAIARIVGDLHEVYRQAPQRERWDRIAGPEPMDEQAVEQAIHTLNECEAQLPQTKAGAPYKSFVKALASNITAAWSRDWEGFFKSGLAKTLAVDKAEQFSSKPIPQPIIDAYQPLIDHGRAVLLDQLRRQNLARFELLRRFDAHYERLRRQHNVLLFADLTDALARRMPDLDQTTLADIYFRLDSRVGHLLLDEFQDTSLDQWSVLHPFAEEIAAHGEPDPEMGARSFFCVGDAKQAIYGWRGGCTALLDELGDQLHLPENALEPLNVSWRSSQTVLDAVNAVFQPIGDNPDFTDHDRHEADIEAAKQFERGFRPHNRAAPLQAVPGHVVLATSSAPDSNEAEDDNEPAVTDTNGADVDSDEDADAASLSSHEQYAAQRIRELYAGDPHQTLGVLVRTNAMTARLMHELRRPGPAGEPALPVSGEGGSPLTDTPAVGAILSALTLADHPGPDRGRSAAAFHVVNSPLGAVIGLTSIEPPAVQRVSQSIRRSLLSDGYAATIARWVRDLAPSCEARSLARLEQLVELAEGYEPELTLRPSRFVEYVERTSVEQVTPAPIRVMTIHRAKGLEFDAVVLAELDKPLHDDFALLIERNRETGPITAVHPCPPQAQRELCDALSTAYHRQRRERRYEDLCALYVAMTRARRSLHMIVRPPKRKSNGGLSKPALSYAEMLRAALAATPREQETDAQVLYEAGDPGWTAPTSEPTFSGATKSPPSPTPPVPLRVQLASPPRDRPRRTWPGVSPSTLAQPDPVRAADLLRLGNNAGLQRGAMLHRWFEQIRYLDDPDAPPQRRALIDAAADMIPGGAEGETPDLDDLIDRFYAMLRASDIDRLLRRKHDNEALWRERGFAVRLDHRLLEGRFDRVAVQYNEQGRPRSALLIDFKTDRLCNDAAIHEAAAHYQPQLAAYREALARMLVLDESAITAKLAFVEPGRCVSPG